MNYWNSPGSGYAQELEGGMVCTFASAKRKNNIFHRKISEEGIFKDNFRPYSHLIHAWTFPVFYKFYAQN